jgi:aryl-alcohol dehydrogenase-like predicted oxidoreductase
VQTDNVKRVYFNDENFRRKLRVEEVASKHGVTGPQIAVAWTLNQPVNVFAIIGPRTVAEVRENVQIAELKLSPGELRYLEHG